MTLVGASNPVGIGTGLNYTGPLVFAYSGAKDGTASFVNYLSFTTGSEIIKGRLDFNGAPSPDDPSTGGDSICRVTMDAQVIAYMKTSTQNPDAAGSQHHIHLIIPSYTKVLVDIRTLANSAFQGTVLFTGEIIQNA